MAEREILTYPDFGVAVREVAQAVADSGFEPDIVLSIARGGLPFGGALGYALDVKNVSVVNVEFYTGVDERLDVPIMLPPTPDVVDLSGMTVLVCDDVADTGRTLKLVQEYVADHVKESRVACIYEKSHSIVKCDYVWKRTDQWIDFPWSSLPPVTGGGAKP
ncbi:phosphoribosyltransferase [Calidifontibacter sp. DB0510]|uniref:Phosphoribosyltransferase n=1 Tax=Metallococcus carri TaxID=1656884 RepID=A0A967EAX1_9MICO|nr:phosphoribosyltransferase [Metallococcus carri]NHN56685.1 phosphoribosyltransferase [Metallococcus carri]NOP38984.1 phosphoribosyltransferase [Calidifontibacter sp. DB2511S]